MSLMDILVGVGAVSKGYQDAARKEREQTSVEEFRKGEIETRRESTKAQKEISTEQAETQVKVQDMRNQATKEITIMTLQNERLMTQIRGMTQKLVAEMQAESAERIAEKRNITDKDIAKLQEALGRAGLQVKREELGQIKSLTQMELIFRVAKMVHDNMWGVNSIYSAYSDNVPGWPAKRDQIIIDSVSSILNAMGIVQAGLVPDPKNLIEPKKGGKEEKEVPPGGPKWGFDLQPPPGMDEFNQEMRLRQFVAERAAPDQFPPDKLMDQFRKEGWGVRNPGSAVPPSVPDSVAPPAASFETPSPHMQRAWWGGLREVQPEPIPRTGNMGLDQTAFIPPSPTLTDDEKAYVRALAMETKAAKPDIQQGMAQEYMNWLDSEVQIPWLTSGNRKGAKEYYNFLLGN